MANEWMYLLPALTQQNSKTDTNQTTNQNSSSNTNQTSNNNVAQLNFSDALQQAIQQALSSSSTSSNVSGTQTGNVANTGTTMSEIPKWLEQASQMGIGNAASLLGQPTQGYNGQLTAGLNPDQTAAGDLIRGSVGQYSPYFDQAKSAISSSMQQGPQVSADTYKNGLQGISDYMNPYISNVVNSVQDFSKQNLSNLLNQTNDQAISANAFGGSRHGVQEGVATAQSNKDTTNLVANLLSGGYDKASSLLGQDIGNNLTSQQANQGNFQNFMNNLLSGGNSLAGLGTTAQNSFNNGVANLLSYGGLAQNTNQTADTNAYNEWLRQQNMPLQLQQLYNQSVSAAPHSTTQTSTANQTSNNTSNQISDTIQQAIQQAISNSNTQTGQYGLQSSQGNVSSNTTANATGNSMGSSNTSSSGLTWNPMQSTTGSNPLMGGLGGAATGAYIGSIIPGIGTAAGAGIGGLLGAGGSLFR
ncbi:MAG: hypothetical protein ACR2IL_10735 [Chitinophagaceae bacterium]